MLAGATTSRNSIFSANTAPVATNASCNGTVVDGGDSELPDPPTEEEVQAALEDIKAGGSGVVKKDGEKD